MHDRLGKKLQTYRIKEAIKYIYGDVIDIGCGNNNLISKYKKNNINNNSIGVDVYPWKGVDCLVKNSHDLPFKDDYFDCCTILASINHIVERDKVLFEASRILKKGGILIITMINPGIGRLWHLIRSKHDTDQIERGMAEGELYGLSKNEIKNLCIKAKFKLIKNKNFILFNNIYIFKNEK